MNYLLYGPDTYRSRKKLREMIAGYAPRVQAGTVDVLRFDAAEDDMSELPAVVRGGSLFGAKKLIVLERPFTAATPFDITRRVLAETHETKDSFVIVWDALLDVEGKKRLKEVEKYFNKRVEFTPLAGVRLHQWIKKEAAARGVALSAADRAALTARDGGDTWGIVQDIEKKALMADSGVAAPSAPPSVFDLGDTFFYSPVAARRILLSLIRAGEDEKNIFWYLAGHTRTLLTVKSYLERGISVPASAHIHPFVVKKASRVVGMLSVGDMTRMLGRFFEEDWRIKTGVSSAQESLLRLLG
ncbi:MAG: hypothetical protein A3B34_00405 [Candidatus Sungbacteria bacterium RIFCSPLOWO2_01_FULL_54_21]|uniref:DNA-directed DNA polymerase n=1 Tax=Candidatus Sungbacteria bacterium RIFCSPLOWO2_01_FULL_54_21 TaxID=1802279 RepID=A0A1G2LA80_9BACT|nr:MAG: hypothetical protein A3B34_00405 [Candidatus Sungbacteria bacterium RIFCSPLOWO2_01_FULL_54_21]